MKGKSLLRHHWPEYVIEAGGLGIFMFSACLFTTLLEHPDSFVRQLIPEQIFRLFLMGHGIGASAPERGAPLTVRPLQRLVSWRSFCSAPSTQNPIALS